MQTPFHERLRSFREDAGLSVSKAATRAGVSDILAELQKEARSAREEAERRVEALRGLAGTD